MVVAVCLAGISTLFYGLSSGFIVLLIMRIFWGIAWSFIRLGGLLTVVSLSQDTNRGNLMGLYNGLWGLGGLTGMLAGGVFVDIFFDNGCYDDFCLRLVFTSPIYLYAYSENRRKRGGSGRS